MRRSARTSAFLGLLLASSVTPTLAETDIDSEAHRVEVPEAGMAMAFPADWSVDVELRQREDFWLSERFPDAAPVLFWNVLYASPGGRPWCDVTWYPAHPLPLAEHAVDYEALTTPDGNVERSIEVEPIVTEAGAGVRFVIWNGPTDDYSTVYLLESGAAHYLVECASDTRDEDDWLHVAGTIEFLTPGDAGPSGFPATPEP